MGSLRAFAALTVLVWVSGLAAAFDGDVLDLEQVALQDASETACSVQGYGVFGTPAAAAPGGYYGGGIAPLAGYGERNYPGQYAASLAGYGDAAVGGYGSAAPASNAGPLAVASPPADAQEAPAAAFLRSQNCAALTTQGRLLGIGGLADCQGTFTPLAPGLSMLTSANVTDAEGRFTVTPAALGTYSWRASGCVDTVTRLPLSYNWEVTAPPYARMVVTDLALLTRPASRNLAPSEQGSAEVFERVYRAFGIDSQQLKIDVVSYKNVTSSSPAWPALLGVNAQLAFIADAVARTLLVLKSGPTLSNLEKIMGPHGEAASRGTQAAKLSDVRGIHDAIWAVLAQQADGRGRELLVSRDHIREVLTQAAGPNDLPEWSTSSARGQEVLFDAVARIVAFSNKEMMQPVVDVALSCANAAAAGMPRLAPECAASTLAIAVASASTLQRRNMTGDIVTLAEAYTNTGSALNTPDTDAGRAAMAAVAKALAGGASSADELHHAIAGALEQRGFTTPHRKQQPAGTQDAAEGAEGEVQAQTEAVAQEHEGELAGSQAELEGTEQQPAAAQATEQQPAVPEATEEQPAAAEATQQQRAQAEATQQQPAAAEAPEQQPAAAEATDQQPAVPEATQPAAAEATEQQRAEAEATQQQPTAAEATQQPAAAAETEDAGATEEEAQVESTDDSGGDEEEEEASIEAYDDDEEGEEEEGEDDGEVYDTRVRKHSAHSKGDKAGESKGGKQEEEADHHATDGLTFRPPVTRRKRVKPYAGTLSILHKPSDDEGAGGEDEYDPLKASREEDEEDGGDYYHVPGAKGVHRPKPPRSAHVPKGAAKPREHHQHSDSSSKEAREEQHAAERDAHKAAAEERKAAEQERKHERAEDKEEQHEAHKAAAEERKAAEQERKHEHAEEKEEQHEAHKAAAEERKHEHAQEKEEQHEAHKAQHAETHQAKQHPKRGYGARRYRAYRGHGAPAQGPAAAAEGPEHTPSGDDKPAAQPYGGNEDEAREHYEPPQHAEEPARPHEDREPAKADEPHDGGDSKHEQPKPHAHKSHKGATKKHSSSRKHSGAAHHKKKAAHHKPAGGSTKDTQEGPGATPWATPQEPGSPGATPWATPQEPGSPGATPWATPQEPGSPGATPWATPQEPGSPGATPWATPQEPGSPGATPWATPQEPGSPGATPWATPQEPGSPGATPWATPQEPGSPGATPWATPQEPGSPAYDDEPEHEADDGYPAPYAYEQPAQLQGQQEPAHDPLAAELHMEHTGDAKDDGSYEGDQHEEAEGYEGNDDVDAHQVKEQIIYSARHKGHRHSPKGHQGKPRPHAHHAPSKRRAHGKHHGGHRRADGHTQPPPRAEERYGEDGAAAQAGARAAAVEGVNSPRDALEARLAAHSAYGYGDDDQQHAKEASVTAAAAAARPSSPHRVAPARGQSGGDFSSWGAQAQAASAATAAASQAARRRLQGVDAASEPAANVQAAGTQPAGVDAADKWGLNTLAKIFQAASSLQPAPSQTAKLAAVSEEAPVEAPVTTQPDVQKPELQQQPQQEQPQQPEVQVPQPAPQAQEQQPTAAPSKPCVASYDEELCRHDLRRECDYGRFDAGAFPPDMCRPYQSFPPSQAISYLKSLHYESEDWGRLEPSGAAEVPIRRKGLTGLLGLLGASGVVGTLPSGGLLDNTVAPVPAGALVIIPGLVLTPMQAPLAVALANGSVPFAFGGNCDAAGNRLIASEMRGDVPSKVLARLPKNACLPAGWLYKFTSLHDAGFSSPSIGKLPHGAVLLSNDQLYVPSKDAAAVKRLVKSIPGIEQTEWTAPKRAQGVAQVVRDRNGTEVVRLTAGSHSPEGRNSSQQASEAARAHGSADCLAQGPPPASCPDQPALAPLGGLAARPSAARQLPARLEGAFLGVGYIEGCAADYYSYSEFVSHDVPQLAFDRAFGKVFKPLVTASGAFALTNVTGRGHVVLTGAWACSSAAQADSSKACLDSWTNAQLKVPLGGLTPKEGQRGKAKAPTGLDVTLSPLGLITLANATAEAASASGGQAAPVAGVYTAALRSLGLRSHGHSPMMTDPVRLIQTGRLTDVKDGLAAMAENARALNTLTTARALYECRATPSSPARLSNELFVQWAGKLLTPTAMASPSALRAQLQGLCLAGGCSDTAAVALAALNKQLSALRAKYDAVSSMPLTLSEDLVTLAQLSHVGQEQLYASISACCASNTSQPGAAAAEPAAAAVPLLDFVSKMDDLVAAAPVRYSNILAAAAASLANAAGGRGSTSGAAPSGSFGGSSPSDPPPAGAGMVGSLLNSGPLQDCKGVFYPAIDGAEPVALTTDAAGQFILPAAAPGRIKFSAALPGSRCVDAATGVPVTFPLMQTLPAAGAATVTAISLLAGPAANDASIRDQVSVDGVASPRSLVNHVYRLYGLDATELDVDFFSFTGAALQLGSPQLAQVSGAIAQTMATLTNGHSLLTGLYGSGGASAAPSSRVSSDQIAACLLAATYDKIAEHGNAVTTLTDKASLLAIYKAAFAACTPASRRRALLAVGDGAAATPASPATAGAGGVARDAAVSAELDGLFSAAANMVAASNQRIQSTVLQADKAAERQGATAATSGKPASGAFNVTSALSNITAVAAVQQAGMAASVGQLAATVAADSHEEHGHELQAGIVQTQISEVEQAYTGASLSSAISDKAPQVSPTALAHVLVNIGQPLMVDSEGHVSPYAPAGAAAPSKTGSGGLSSGAVIGLALGLAIGLLMLAAAVGAAVVLRRRKRGAAPAGAPAAGSRLFGGSSMGATKPTPAAAGAPAPGSLKVLPLPPGGLPVTAVRLPYVAGAPAAGAARSDADGATPRSTAGPVAEGAQVRSEASCGVQGLRAAFA